MDHRVWEALHCSKLREAWLGQSKLCPSPPLIPCVIITISEYSFFTITWHVYCYTFFGCLSRWGTTTSGTSFGLRCKIEWITVRPCSLTSTPHSLSFPGPDWLDFASDWDWSSSLKMQFPRFLNAGLHATSADLPPPFLTAELHQCASVDPRLVRPAATQRTESSMWRTDSD